jgi:hypothetical protein
LRLSVIEAAARELRMVGTLHDAVFLESPEAVIEAHARVMAEVMQQASETYLQGHRLRVGAKITRYPDHFYDPDARERWEQIRKLLLELSGVDIEQLSEG